MNQITNLICELKEYDSIRENLDKRISPIEITGLSPIHRAHLVAALSHRLQRPAVIICADDTACARFARDLEPLLEQHVPVLPYRDFVFHDVESSSREYEHKRISLLHDMKEKHIPVILSVPSLLAATIPPEVMEQATFCIQCGEEYELDELALRLVRAGYRRCAQVEGEGQFALRGGLLDIFAPGEGNPVRIEFFGDEVDTMSYFDIGSQRRGRALQALTCLPNREVLIDMAPGGVDGLVEQLEKIRSSRAKKHPDLNQTLRRDIERLEQDSGFASIDRYLPLIYPGGETAADYIPEDALIFWEDMRSIREASRVYQTRLREDIMALVERGELYGKIGSFAGDWTQILDKLNRGAMVYLESFLASVSECPPGALVDITAKQLPAYGGSVETAASDIQAYQAMNYRVIVLCSSDTRCRTMHDMLDEQGVNALVTETIPTEGAVHIMEGSLSTGFEFPTIKLAVVTEGQVLTSTRKKSKRRKSNRDHVKSYTDLTPGDLVVHEHHGIGRFVGMERVKVDGHDADFVKIAFAGTDFLYVPATSLDLISKYIGSGGEESHVRLNKLGGTDWQKARHKAKAAAKELAGKLIQLYAQREREVGFAFPEDDSFQRDFEAAFEYEETEDQLRCAEEIKTDMESTRPMDRLLCGDVGFGKTEVAMRAAMKCVLGGKQAAILVPTTVLARQHYLTAVQRFAGWPVKIEMLSRFKSAKEQKIIMERVRRGDVDLLIGTHKLFNKGLEFHDLGLLIVDEEQRFGVTHKEKLKEISRQVDVLTLSATPIPRTLNMALSGIRDMSVLEEPPHDRHPVQTYVMEYDNGVIVDALRREMYRGGQSYYLHNRVENIERTAADLQKQLPDAEIAVAHGKMSQRELANVMTRMSDGEIDILVCTTIIETGIDIPNVNTLIIEDADHMGLSQLHQLRGRVGRSARRAFAYFTFRRGKTLSEMSQKRLNAVREFAEFGSGFKIAMRDLEIRGAGNVLGPEQSGHLMTVGYDLYLKLLEEAVLEEKGETPKPRVECAASLLVSANIPQSYISDDGQRVDLYRRIAMIHTEEDRTDMLDEMIDRWGDPPASAAALCDIALLRSEASEQGITEIKQTETHLNLYWEKADFRRLALLCADPKRKGRLMLNAGSSPYVSLRLRKGEKSLDMARGLVEDYAAIPENSQ